MLIVYFILFIYFLASLCGLRDLSSLTRDGTWALAVKALSPNHWTAREFPMLIVSITKGGRAICPWTDNFD